MSLNLAKKSKDAFVSKFVFLCSLNGFAQKSQISGFTFFQVIKGITCISFVSVCYIIIELYIIHTFLLMIISYNEFIYFPSTTSLRINHSISTYNFDVNSKYVLI